MAEKETLQIKDLVAGETYAIQVRALGDGDEIANSPWSLTLTQALSEDVTAPGAPQSLDLKAVGGAFRATWTQPTQDGDGGTLNDLKDYMVVWSETSNAGNNYTQYIEAAPATLTFEQNQEELGAVPDVTVTVYARDHANNVTVSPPTDAVTNVAPTVFTGLTAAPDETNGTAIAVEWPQPSGTAPDGSDNGNDISYYEVYRDLKKIEDVAFSPGTMRYLDPDPRPGTHDYEVVAVDLFGNTFTSNSDSATPAYLSGADSIAPNPPAFPGGISGDFLTGGVPADSRDGTDAYIDVTFDAPTTSTDASNYTDNEGFLIKWNVTGSSDVFERSAIDSRQDPPTDPVETTVRINGLKAGVSYDVEVSAFDTSRNYSTAISGTETTPSDTTAPGQPSAPTASNDTQSVLVSHDLTLQAGGTLPIDVVEMNVYASTTSGFTPSSANQIGSVPVTPGVAPVQKFPLPSPESSPGAGAETWYFKVVAVDAAGNESAASPEVSATSDLIQGANILNATIDDAKINELSANKIVAGTGIIQDLTITTGGSFTVDATGFMKSSNWDGTDGGSNSSTGWWMGNDGLVINDGVVEASTFSTIEGNLVPYEYSIFPAWERWYQSNLWTTGGADPNLTEIGTDGSGSLLRYGYQSLAWSPDTAADEIMFGTSQTDYNIPVKPSGTDSPRYVYSAYVYNDGVSNASISMIVKDSDGVQTVSSSETLSAGEERRISTEYFTSGTATAVEVGFRNESGAAATFLIDGVQFERVSEDSSGLPSIFMMPGGTIINGNSITTGQIESSSYEAGVSGWQINLTGDVEFRNGIFRGTIEAQNGTIEGQLAVGFTSGSEPSPITDFAGLIVDTGATPTGDLYIGEGIVPASTAGEWVGIALDGQVTNTLAGDHNNFWGVRDDGVTYFKVGDGTREMIFNSDAATFDLFNVTLNGADGNFTGTITATAGTIGDLSLTGKLTASDLEIGSDIGNVSGRNGLYVDGTVFNSFWRQGTRTYFRVGDGSNTYIKYDSDESGDKINIVGNVTMNGDFTASSATITGATITGGTITGGTVQTATSGQRIVIDGNNFDEIRMYSGVSTEFALIKVFGSELRIQGPADPSFTSQIQMRNDSLRIFADGATTGFIFDDFGVGFGDSTPDAVFDTAINRQATQFYRSTTSTGAAVQEIRSNVGGTNSQVGVWDADGDIRTATGVYGTLSDDRLKSNVRPARSYLSDLNRIDVIKYRLRQNEVDFLGVSAQQVEQVFPGLVKNNMVKQYEFSTDEEGMKTKRVVAEEEVKSVKTSLFIPMLITAMQELSAEVDQLKAALASQ